MCFLVEQPEKSPPKEQKSEGDLDNGGAKESTHGGKGRYMDSTALNTNTASIEKIALAVLFLGNTQNNKR